MTMDEWMSVIKLSDMWQFPKMRMKAINPSESQVQILGAVDMILLAKKYSISRWLTKGYDILARRPKYITSDERKRLDLDTFVRLVEVREKSWKYGYEKNQSEYGGSNREQFTFAKEIQAVFREELMEDDDYRSALSAPI